MFDVCNIVFVFFLFIPSQSHLFSHSTSIFRSRQLSKLYVFPSFFRSKPTRPRNGDCFNRVSAVQSRAACELRASYPSAGLLSLISCALSCVCVQLATDVPLAFWLCPASVHSLAIPVSRSLSLFLSVSVCLPSSGCLFQSAFPPFPQVDIIGAMVIVWRARGKISGLFCAILCATIVHSAVRTHEQT